MLSATLLLACIGCGEPKLSLADGDRKPSVPDASADGSMDSGPNTTMDAGNDATVEPSGGCGASVAAGFNCFDVSFGGNTRNWCMNIPEGYDSNRAYSIMLGLHGCGGRNTNVHSHRANMEAYGKDDFLFAYPQAVNTETACWSGADIAFVEYVIDTVTSDYCVNEGRVFVHGMSSGLTDPHKSG